MNYLCIKLWKQTISIINYWYINDEHSISIHKYKNLYICLCNKNFVLHYIISIYKWQLLEIQITLFMKWIKIMKTFFSLKTNNWFCSFHHKNLLFYQIYLRFVEIYNEYYKYNSHTCQNLQHSWFLCFRLYLKISNKGFISQKNE